MKNKLITVFGGSGFLGRYVVQELAKNGAQIRVAVRNPTKALFLKTLGGFVGQISIVQVDVNNNESIARVIADADYVVNLIGVLYEKGRNTFKFAHVTAAKNIATVSKKRNVKRLVHVSAIGANPKAKSKYASTKGRGEHEVLSAFSDATIVRPSIMFGEEDKFFNMFAGIAKISPVLPLIGGGNTQLQPVYVADVAKAIYQLLSKQKDGLNPYAGKIYELGGPKIYRFKDIMAYILKVTERKRFLMRMPFAIAKMASYIMQFLPTPILTPDQVKMLKTNNIVSDDALTFNELGIQPTAVEFVVPSYLIRYRYYG